MKTLSESEQIAQEEEALEQIFTETITDINTAFADYGVSGVQEALLFYRTKLEAAITEFEFRYGKISPIRIRIENRIWDFTAPEEMDFELYENLTKEDFVGGDEGHWFVYRAATKELHEYGPIGYHHQHTDFEIV